MLINDYAALEAARDKAYAMVTKRALASGGAAAIPSGMVGVTADIGLLLNMLPQINRAFGLDQEQVDSLDEQSRQQVFMLAGNLGNMFIGRLISKELILAVLKRVGVRATTKAVASWVPLVGSGVAAVLSFGMMKYVGNQHVDECYRVIKAVLDAETSKTAPATADA